MQNPNILSRKVHQISYFTILQAIHFEVPCPINVHVQENNFRSVVRTQLHWAENIMENTIEVEKSKARIEQIETKTKKGGAQSRRIKQ